MDIAQPVIDAAATALSRALARLPFFHAAQTFQLFQQRKAVDAQAVLIPLIVTLPTSASAYSATYDTFVSKSDQILLISEIRPIVAIRAVTSETLTITNVGNLNSVREREAMKAGNARATLKLPDQNWDLTEDAVALPLNTAPIILPRGRELVIPPTQKVRMTVALTDTTAAIVGGSTDYGVLLIGQYTHERLLTK